MVKSFEQKIAEEIKVTKSSWNSRIGAAFRLTDSEIRQIFATKHEVNLERDEKGMPIPGTGRVITSEEKKMVFDFILENDYPLTKRMYNIVLYAYLDNEIELNINNGPKL